MANDPDFEHLLRRLPHLKDAVPGIRAAAEQAVAMLYGGRRAETTGVLLALAPVLDGLRADPRVRARDAAILLGACIGDAVSERPDGFAQSAPAVTAKALHGAGSALNGMFQGDYGMRLRFYADRGLGFGRGPAFFGDVVEVAKEFRRWTAQRRGHEARRTPHDDDRQRTASVRTLSRKAATGVRQRRTGGRAQRPDAAVPAREREGGDGVLGIRDLLDGRSAAPSGNLRYEAPDEAAEARAETRKSPAEPAELRPMSALKIAV